MIVESAAVKTAIYAIAGSLGYLAWAKGCEQAGVKEPIANTLGAGIRFSSQLSKEFGNCLGESPEQKALRVRAEMAARTAYAEVLAQTGGGSVTGNTPVTN